MNACDYEPKGCIPSGENNVSQLQWENGYSQNLINTLKVLCCLSFFFRGVIYDMKPNDEVKPKLAAVAVG